MTTLLGRSGGGTVQRQAEPADIDIQDEFNPLSILHQLLNAIDQSDTYMAGGTVYQPVLKRNVNFAAVVRALNGLTATQAKRVEADYAAHENKRSLETDLFGKGESDYDSNVDKNEEAQIRALLAGTKAEKGAGEPEQAAVATHNATAQAAEVQRLLKGKPGKANVEQVMAILRQSTEANSALNEAYKRLGGLLYVDLERTGQSPRAELLMEGRWVEADALKVGGAQRRLEELNPEIKKLEALVAPKELSLENLVLGPSGMEQMLNQQKLSKLRAERTKLIAEIEATGQQAITEAHREKGDVTARVSAVFGDVAGLKAAVGDTSAPVLKAMIDNKPAMRVAAELRRSAEAGKLTGPQLTAALRSLRAEAEAQAARALGEAPPDIVKAKADEIASDYFREVRATYDDLTKGDAKRKPFDEIVKETGNAGDETLNKELVASSGQLSDVRELVLALRGDRKDMATVERVLRNKDALTIKILKSQYTVMTMGRSLDHDLFGLSGTKAGEDDFSGLAMAPADMKGKASGTARLNLEDYMQRPDEEGGPAEVLYIWSRAMREYEYTLEHGGITGSINDAWGNEPRKLLDETKTHLSLLVLQYRRLLGWDPASKTILYPDDIKSPEALRLIHEMRLARHTIRGDRAAYEEATAKLRATFEAIASFVIQAALSAVLTPAAAALFRVAKGTHAALTLGNQVRKFAAALAASTGSNIGSTIAVTGDYSLAQLKTALAGGAAGQFGGLAFDKVLGRVAKGLADQKNWSLSVELREFAKNTVSTETSLWTEGKSLLEDPSITRLLTEHLQGRGGELITAGVTKVGGLEGPADGGTETAPPAGGESTTGAGGGTPPATGDAAPAATGAPVPAVGGDATGGAAAAPLPVGGGATAAGVAGPPAPLGGETQVAAAAGAPTPVPAGGEAAAAASAAPAKPTGGGGDGGGDGGGGSDGGAGPVVSPPKFAGSEHNVTEAAKVLQANANNGNVVVIDNRTDLQTRFRDLGMYSEPPPRLWYENHDGRIVIVVDRTRVPGAGGAPEPGALRPTEPKPKFAGSEHRADEAAKIVQAQAGNGNVVVINDDAALKERFRGLGMYSDPPPKMWFEEHGGNTVIVVDGTRVPGADRAELPPGRAPGDGDGPDGPGPAEGGGPGGTRGGDGDGGSGPPGGAASGGKPERKPEPSPEQAADHIDKMGPIGAAQETERTLEELLVIVGNASAAGKKVQDRINDLELKPYEHVTALDFRYTEAIQKRVHREAMVAIDSQFALIEGILSDLGVENATYTSVPKREALPAFVDGVIGKCERNGYSLLSQMDDVIRGRVNVENAADVTRVVNALYNQGEHRVQPNESSMPRFWETANKQPTDIQKYPRYHVIVKDSASGITHEWQIGTEATSKLYQERKVQIPEALDAAAKAANKHFNPDLHDIEYDVFQAIAKKHPQVAAQYGLPEFIEKVAAASGESRSGEMYEHKILDKAITDLSAEASAILNRMVAPPPDGVGAAFVASFFH
ncbi:MAG: hypothetical protein WD557_08925 [Dehalococcoidia bacterium]